MHRTILAIEQVSAATGLEISSMLENQAVAGLGQGAWISGGTTLYVLAREG